MTVNILGTEYTIEKHKREEDANLKDANGYFEMYSKKIVVCDIEEDERNFENIEAFKNKVLRHEIIHAFFGESGMYNDYCVDETLVDWIALQLPKIVEAVNSLEIMGNKPLNL